VDHLARLLRVVCAANFFNIIIHRSLAYLRKTNKNTTVFIFFKKIELNKAGQNPV